MIPEEIIKQTELDKLTIIDKDKKRLEIEQKDKEKHYSKIIVDLKDIAALHLAALISRKYEKLKDKAKYEINEKILKIEDLKRQQIIEISPKAEFINYPFYPLLTATYRTNKFFALYEFPYFLQSAIEKYYNYNNLKIALTSMTRQIDGIGNLKIEFKSIDTHSNLLTLSSKIPTFLQKIDYSNQITIYFKSPVAIQNFNKLHQFVGYLPLFWKHYLEIIADVVNPNTFERNVEIPLPLDAFNFSYLLQIVIIGDFILLKRNKTDDLPEFILEKNFVIIKSGENEGYVVDKSEISSIKQLIIIPLIFYNLLLYPTNINAINLNYANFKDFTLQINNQCIYYEITPVFLCTSVEFKNIFTAYSPSLSFIFKISEILLNFLFLILLHKDLIKLPKL